MSESHLPGFSLSWTLRNWRSFNGGRRAVWIILYNLRREAACVQRQKLRGRTKLRTFITGDTGFWIAVVSKSDTWGGSPPLKQCWDQRNDKKLPDVSWDALSMSKNLMRVIYDHLHIECNSRCFTHRGTLFKPTWSCITYLMMHQQLNIYTGLWLHVGLCTHTMTFKASKV